MNGVRTDVHTVDSPILNQKTAFWQGWSRSAVTDKIGLDGSKQLHQDFTQRKFSHFCMGGRYGRPLCLWGGFNFLIFQEQVRGKGDFLGDAGRRTQDAEEIKIKNPILNESTNFF